MMKPWLSLNRASPPTLEAKGYRLIHRTPTEPWGQFTARVLSPEGLAPRGRLLHAGVPGEPAT